MKKLILICLAAFTQNAIGQTSGTYTLKQCIDIALANNITMQQMKLQAEGGKVAVDQAKMNRYPNLNAGASQSVNFGRSVNPYDNTVVANQQVNSNNLSLSSSLNLFQGFQNQLTIQQRQLNLSAAEADILTTRNNVVLGVVDAFATVLSSKALLSSSVAQNQSTKAQMERTDILVKSGKLPMSNYLDLKGQDAIEETNIVVAENQLELAKVSLAQWMQVDPTIVRDVQEPQLVINEADFKPAPEIYAVAEPNQPQIKAAQLRVIGAQKGISIAKSSYYPSLNFQAGLFTNYSSIAQKFVPGSTLPTPVYQPIDFYVDGADGTKQKFTIYQQVNTGSGYTENLSFADQFDNNLRKGFSFNLNIPIFNGRQTRYAIENARITKLNADLELMKQKNQLRQTIETATSNEKAARLRFKAVEKQIAALEEVFRSAESRFNLGVMNSVDYLVAKNNLTRAQNDKARYKYDFFIRRAILDFYLGKELNFN